MIIIPHLYSLQDYENTNKGINFHVPLPVRELNN